MYIYTCISIYIILKLMYVCFFLSLYVRAQQKLHNYTPNKCEYLDTYCPVTLKISATIFRFLCHLNFAIGIL